MTNIELYEALKADVSEKAARMIAEVVPHASDVATKTFVRGEFERFEARMDRRFEQLEARMDHRSERLEQRFDRAFRLAIVFVGPIWAGGIAAIIRTLFFG